MSKNEQLTLEFPKPARVFNKQVFDYLYDYDSRVDLWYGGASSGKSAGVVQKVILKALGDWKIPRRFLILRKVGATVKDSIFEDFISRLTEWGLMPYAKVRNTDYRIKLSNGAEFIFKGLDNPEKIKSVKGISDVMMEEATEFTLDDFNQLDLRLREREHPQKQIFIMFNPVSKANWVYKQFFDRTDPDTKIHLSTYRDNKFLDDANRRRIEQLSETNGAYYKIYALGEFATLDKLIFPKYEKRLLRADSDELKGVPSYFGLDFGYTNDPTAFVHIKLDVENKVLYILEATGKIGMLNGEIAQMIKDLGHSKETIIADAAEPKSIAEIRKAGIDRITTARKGPDSIRHGIEYLQQFRIVVDERLFQVIEELDNYTWQKDKKTGEYINKPVDSFNHFLDAVRYAADKQSLKSADSFEQKLRKARTYFG